jgi:hypothetical protein
MILRKKSHLHIKLQNLPNKNGYLSQQFDKKERLKVKGTPLTPIVTFIFMYSFLNKSIFFISIKLNINKK